MIIYTAIFDDYDRLPPHFWKADKNTEFYCISNCIKPKKYKNWNIIHKDINLDGTRKNRYFKINSHKIFPNEKYVVYIDPTFLIIRNFENLIDKWLGDNDIAVMMHDKRDSIYDEAIYLIEKKPHKIDDIEIVKKQIDMFNKEGFPRECGMNQGGFLVRKHTKNVRKFNEYWWKIVKNYSKRDQLSFTYVSWKLKIPYSVIPRNEVEYYTKRCAWHK